MARCKDDLEDVEVQVEEGEALAAKSGGLRLLPDVVYVGSRVGEMDMIGDALLKMLLDQYEIPKSSRDQVWRGKKQWGWLATYLCSALRLGVLHFRVAARSLAAMRHLPQRPTQSDNADEIGDNVSGGQEWELHTLPREPFIIPIFWAYTGFQGKFLWCFCSSFLSFFWAVLGESCFSGNADPAQQEQGLL